MWEFMTGSKEHTTEQSISGYSTTAKSTNERDHKKCHCRAQGQFICSMKYALSSKESLKGLQLQASSERNLAGLWPYGCLYTDCVRHQRDYVNWNSKGQLQRSIKRKAKGHISFWTFLCVSDFKTSNLAAQRPAGLQFLQLPPHFTCSAFKQHWKSASWLMVLKQRQKKKNT